jgi:anaerobic C4-dicarboxylate transporter
MKNLFKNFVVWDMFVAVFFANSIITLITNAYADNLENNNVVASIIHALVIIYGYNYFKNRKSY